MSLNLNKYFIVYEGEKDIEFINSIKTIIIRNKKIVSCKYHRNKITCIGGSLDDKKIHLIEEISSSKCCKVFVFVDEDKNSNTQERIDSLLKLNSKLTKIIISKPSIEIVLYSIFNYTKSILDQKTIEEKLKKYLKKYGIDYKHADEKVYAQIISIIEKDDVLKNQWFNNLKKLKEDGRSYFYDYIEFLEKTK